MGAVGAWIMDIVSAIVLVVAIVAIGVTGQWYMYVLLVIAAMATIAAVYFTVIGQYDMAMMMAAIGIAAGVGGIWLAAGSELATAGALASEGTAEAVAASESMYTTGALQVVGYAQTTYAGMGWFLEAIHFKLLLSIHQMAMLVSPAYRSMVNGLYNNINQVSQALGWGWSYMNIFMRDTRQLVMDTSAMMGNGYDMADLTWWSTFMAFTKERSGEFNAWAKDPVAFLMALDDSVGRPSMEMKGAITRTLISTMEAVVTGAKTMAEGITLVETDLKRLVADLPSAITRGFKPELDKLWKYTDDFMRLTYDPAMKAISGAMTAFGASMEKTKGELTDVVGRLKRPGKYIAEVDELSAEERAEDQEVLAAISFRGLTPQLAEFNEGLAGLDEEINRVIAEETIVEEMPPAPSPEPGVPSLPGPPRKRIYKTPFVGEY